MVWQAIAFGVTPVLNYVLQDVLSRPRSLFQQVQPLGYVDLTFVPFNVALFWAIAPANVLPLFLIALTVNLAFHYVWAGAMKNRRKRLAFFDKGVLTPAGFVHLVFATMQMTFVLIFLFSPAVSATFATVCAISLMAYAFTGVWSAHMLHNGTPFPGDMLVMMGVLLAALVKLVFVYRIW